MRRIEHNVRATNENLVQRVDTFEDNITEQIRDIKELIGKTHPTVHRDAASADAPTRHAAQIPATPPGPCTDVTRLDSAPLAVTTRQLGESIPDEHLSTAFLGGEAFPFDKTKLPDPPTIHLSKDIDRLCREWEASTLLVVNGRSIPVKYWPEFYKKGKGAKASAWQALRVEWGNWKVRHHSPSVSLCQSYL